MSDANNTDIVLGTGADALRAGSWYNDAYYQILLVKRNADKAHVKSIRTKIVAAQRKNPKSDSKAGKYFSDYKLDEKTIERLSSYPKPPDFDKENISIATYLPSPGVVFPLEFIKTLSRENIKARTGASENSQDDISSYYNYSIEVNNFYDPIRTLLYTRKISQIIAKTWYAYLHAKEKKVSIKVNGVTEKLSLWDCFIQDKWHEFGDNIDILDSLIAREIFLTPQNSGPDDLEPDNLNIYYPLKSQSQGKNTRFLILPNSKAWQGITLSLLLAGQAYYGVDKDGKYTNDEEPAGYHQIAQPILSTGEIVMKYGLKTSWDTFKGNVTELSLSPGDSSIAYQAVIPYPPIPAEHNISRENIKAWAYAKDDDGDFPFYHKEGENYLVDVQYFSPPYPYIPLSSS
jgi:hypothetical protein